jgi:hypothetical protein
MIVQGIRPPSEQQMPFFFPPNQWNQNSCSTESVLVFIPGIIRRITKFFSDAGFDE